MINYVFDLCVRILMVLAKHCGMTYKAVNVWIFVIIWPLITLFLLGLALRQHLTIRRLRAQLARDSRTDAHP